MKKKELEKKLKKAGWWLARHGGNHDIWTNSEIKKGNLRMELEGKIWKHKNHWLVEVPSLNTMTQGKTRKEALFMIKDAIMEYMGFYFESQIEGFEILINDYKSTIGISSNNNKLLLALSLRKQREKSGLTMREVSEHLGTKSINSYAQYEKGKTRISLDQYERLLHAANPNQTRFLRVV